MLRARGRGGVCSRGSGALEACCGYWLKEGSHVEVFASRALEVRCRRGDSEAGRYGDLEAHYRCSDMYVWRHGALEARYRCIDVETWRYGDLDACCRREDVEV